VQLTGLTRPPTRPFQLTSPVQRPGFRADIEGLRAVAVLMVLLAHAGVPFLAGGFAGVDVFFVISGFLITARISQEIHRTGRFSVRRFYAARIERLLPAATLTLYAVFVMMLLFLPRARWRETSFDILASAAYFVNWRLTERSADYFAASSPPSAVQHFWSLSVEEQFYLVWPLLFLGVLGLAKLKGWPVRRIWRPLLAGLGGIALLSFGWAVFLTTTSPETAYFRTSTRMWELAVGAGLALVAGKLAVRRLPWRAMAWTGAAALLCTTLFFGEASRFPGVAALLPTLGTVLLLVAGLSREPTPVTAGLSTTPMRAIGALSYSLYLWHWPLLVVFAANFGELSVLGGLAVTALSAIPAYLSFCLVERPIRQRGWLRRSPGNALAAAAAAAMLTIVPAFFAGAGSGKPVERAQSALDDIRNGAAVLGPSPRGDVLGTAVDEVPAIVPDPASAASDLPDVDRDGCFATPEEAEPKFCQYGKADAAYRIVLAGDSHAVQWVPALRAVAEAKGWSLTVYGKSACPFVPGSVSRHQPPYESYPECGEWNNAVRDRIMTNRPQLVITTSYRFGLIEDGKALTGTANQTARIAAMRQSWSRLTEAGIAVAVLRDTPLPPFNVADCVSGNLTQLTKCSFDREPALQGIGDDQVTAAQGLTGVRLLDFTDAICPLPVCAPVIGGVLIYRDGDHLTATYALSLAPRLLTALEPLVASTASPG
jgi:peptidoglycan/LPS O-acetylase OafA/YrhL